MKAGFFEIDITPFIGMERPGGYGKSYIDRIHDPLKARVLLCEENEKIAIIVIDALVVHSRKFVEEIREILENKIGIKKENVMISATHTHSGGPLFGFLPTDYNDAPEIVKKLIKEYSTIPDPYYYDFVKKRIIDAVIMADIKKEEVFCQAGFGYESSVSFNRRFKMKNGRIYTHPGKKNPDIIEPAGPIDPYVGVLSFWNKNEKFIGCLLNFSCHCTTSPGGASSDWLYYTEKIIRKVMGYDSNVILLQGASGDITQVNNLSDRYDFGEEASYLVGTKIGLESLKIILTNEKGEFSPLKVKNRIIKLKRRKQSEEKLKKAEEIVKRGLEDENIRKTTEWTFAKERVILDYLIRKEPEIEFEIQAIQIGPVIIISTPGEIFSSIGLEIKSKSDFPVTFFVELSNGFAGYIPEKKDFLPEGGGYETVLTSYSNLEIEAGEKIIKECLDLIKEFEPGKLPDYNKVDIPGKPWSYGVLGPDID